jgi:predicted ATPase/class 3 adenylate cyclase
VVEPPAGTVTLLFTDIEGSTALAQELGATWGDVLRDHHAVVGGAIAAHGGYVDGTEGDAFFAVFEDARAALSAAVDAQRGLRGRPWPTPSGALKVRMGLHTGHVERRATGYVGLEIHRAARVASAAHGGQVLLTDVVRSLTGDLVPTDDLGRHRLKDFPAPESLHCVVLDGVGAAAFPPPRTLEVRPTNLPADDRPLIGRDADLAAVVQAFTSDGDRLVTLTGMGGTGKTRLALAAGAALLDSHPGGVWWVPLAAETDGAAVLPAIAAAVHAEHDGSRPLRDALAARFSGAPALVVLDNLEQLPGAADAVAGLVAAAPGVRVLATSQSPLHLTAERVLALEPLAPGASRELFARVAARVRPGLDVLADPEGLAVADELCARLDHLPLAIELAAGRLSVLSPAQLRERLAAPLKLLKGGERDRPERQRSLRATIDWTLGLLDPEPRALFTRLGAFAGAVELEDLEAVCEDDDVDVLTAVAALLDVGILRRREDGSGAVTFRLAEALRLVAADELAAAPDGAAWRRAHAEHLAAVMRPAGTPMVCSAREMQRAMALDAEGRRALEWAWANDVALAARLGAPMTTRWVEAGRVQEAAALSDRILALPEQPAETRAFALLGLGYVAMVNSDADRSLAPHQAVQELLGPEHPLHRYALVAEVWTRAMAGREANSAADRLMALVRAHGSHLELGAAQIVHFQTRLAAGDLAAAATALAEAARLCELTGAKMLWHIETCRGDLALIEGRHADAARAYVRSMTAASARGDLLQVWLDLLGIAASLAAAGRAEEALEVEGLAQGLANETGVARAMEVPGAEQLERAAEAVGPEAAMAAQSRGVGVRPGRRVERARELAEAAASVTR